MRNVTKENELEKLQRFQRLSHLTEENIAEMTTMEKYHAVFGPDFINNLSPRAVEMINGDDVKNMPQAGINQPAAPLAI